MKKLQYVIFAFVTTLFLFVSCSDKNELPTPTKPGNKNVSPISQFVYDGLSTYYLWSNEMISKKPTVNDNDPVRYFYNSLYKIDTDNGWSWITDDINELLGGFAGESKSFGYSLGGFVQIDNVIFAIVRYVFANTPASEVGMQRLDLIGEIDGQPITANSDGYISERDINKLYGDSPASFTTYKFIQGKIILKNEDVRIAPIVTNTDPVLFDKVYKIGDKKIGYLFYTNFIRNYNDRLFDVFTEFKNEGVTDLILDLRYNPGGGVSAASYLVSLFAPETSVKNKSILTTLTYNEFLNDYFGSDRDTKLGEYKKSDEPNPLIANLNLEKVYVIATDKSASASELTIFCSRAILGESNIIHIGGKTSGKYTASLTIHPYSDNDRQTVPIYDEKKLSSKQKDIFKNWAMQPIVAIYKDKNGKDFVNPGYLEPNYPLQEGFGYIDYWKAIGDTEDVFLGQALYLITGEEVYKPIAPVLTRSNQRQMIEIKSKQNDTKALILDNIELTTDDFNKIRLLKR